METVLSKHKETQTPASDYFAYSFTDLVDIKDLQQLLEHFSKLTCLPIGILDQENNILASAGWQNICMNFHRINPEAAKYCSQSDSTIKKNLATQSPISYKCKHGLWDVAYPVIVEGKHIATVFFGQFFIDEKEKDKDFFERQAEKFGFDKTKYLKSVNEVPVISAEKVEHMKNFNATLAHILTQTGYSNLLLKKEKIEELRLANEQIKESELKFRKLFEQAGVGVVQAETSTGRFLKVNKKFADMLGYSIDELLQMTFKSITHPDDLERNLDQINLFQKKQVHEFSTEKRYVRKNGTILWAILTVTGMSEAAGGVMTNIGIAQDITERIKVEQELIESELKFKKLFEQSGVGIAQVQISTGMFINVNKKFADMLGYTTDEMLQLTFKNITYPDDLKRSVHHQSLILKKQINEFSVEKRYVRKDGTMFWAMLTASSMGEMAGGDQFQIAVIQDITERIKAEQVLREDNERFQATMNAIDSVVYVADLENYEILFVNKYVKDLFGEITGKKCYSALQGKTMPCDFCTNPLLRDINGNANRPYIWEFQNLITKRWYQCHDQAIRWTNGRGCVKTIS